MHISWLRARIIIQKNETVIDQYGNHKSEWKNYYTCWATGASSGRSGDESEEAGHTTDNDRVDFTIRWCSETALINPKSYRVLYGEHIYNITSVDWMDFRHISLKLHTERVER